MQLVQRVMKGPFRGLEIDHILITVVEHHLTKNHGGVNKEELVPPVFISHTKGDLSINVTYGIPVIKRIPVSLSVHSKKNPRNIWIEGDFLKLLMTNSK
jgi:hypothetical protein